MCWSALLAGASFACHVAAAQDKKPTAQEIVAAIQQHVGVPWKTPTVDTFKAGNPDTPVTGIAVTMMATLDVLQRAAANGAARQETPAVIWFHGDSPCRREHLHVLFFAPPGRRSVQ